MNVKYLAFATATIVSLVSAPVFAGGVTNRYTTRHGKVNSTLDVESYRYEHGHSVERNQNLKVESFGPGFAYSEVKFDGTNITGSAYADNVVNNPDPFSIAVFSDNVTRTNFVDETWTNFSETFKGTETMRQHDVEAF